MCSEIKRLGFKSQTLGSLECLGPVRAFTAACLLWGIPKPAWVSAPSLISYHFFHPFPESLPFSILFPNLPERQRDFTSPFSQLLCLPVYAPVLSLCHSWTVIIWGFLERIKGSMSLNWPLCPLDRVVFKEDQECINSFLFSLSFRHCFFFFSP